MKKFNFFLKIIKLFTFFLSELFTTCKLTGTLTTYSNANIIELDGSSNKSFKTMLFLITKRASSLKLI